MARMTKLDRRRFLSAERDDQSDKEHSVCEVLDKGITAAELEARRVCNDTTCFCRVYDGVD
jgi:hypothetical protein